ADNEYLHKDFHGALNCGIRYLHEHFGEEAVRHYLRDFAREYYAPLRERLKTDGLSALRQHFESIYRAENASFSFAQSAEELTLTIDACPAVTHIRSLGDTPCELFVETTRTVNQTICEDTPYEAQLLSYDEQTGASAQRFSRRQSS
ncbi:MAG: hypothetical protein KAI66_21565, partial [Lentisphaeria bacterium]|nr:hypothetical protein [Lentisphaeria bacterium]